MAETAVSTTTKPAQTVAAQPPAPVQPKTPLTIGGSIAALIPQDLDQAFRLSTALARAGNMVPAAFQGKPDEIMAAVLRGMEVGLAPMQSLQWIAVINGRATIWGDAIPALLLRRGHFVDVELSGEGDAMTATATVTRSDGRKIVRTFSMADAKKAGLADKAGPWKQYPKRMLSHRARTFAARDGAPDALMGIEIAEEVIDHVGPDNARDVTPKPGRGVYVDDAPAATDDSPFGGAETVEDGEIVETAEQRAKRELHEAAAGAAAQGVRAFSAWWKALGEADRAEVKTRMATYEAAAKKADADAEAALTAETGDLLSGADPQTETARTVDFDAILTGIKRELVNGNVPSDIRDLFADELAAMKAQRPDLHAQAEAALTEAAA